MPAPGECHKIRLGQKSVGPAVPRNVLELLMGVDLRGSCISGCSLFSRAGTSPVSSTWALSGTKEGLGRVSQVKSCYPSHGHWAFRMASPFRNEEEV